MNATHIRVVIINLWLNSLNMSEEDFQSIAVLGGAGTVGRATVNQLSGYEVTVVDQVSTAEYSSSPNYLEADLRSYEEVLTSLEEVDPDVVIQLARKVPEVEGKDGLGRPIHVNGESNWNNEYTLENVKINENVLRAAHETDIPTTILASSVHAGVLPVYSSSMSLEDTPEPYQSIIEERRSDVPEEERLEPKHDKPSSPYGLHKRFSEEAAEYHTDPDIHNLETNNFNRPLDQVVCARIGAMEPDGEPPDPEKFPYFDTIWLSEDDWGALVESIIQTDPQELEDPFHTVYAMSDNDGLPFSTQNPFGWEPEDNAADHLDIGE